MWKERLKVYDFELRQALFAEIDQRFSSPKARRKALEIMEATITCLARRGYQGVTLDMIARTAGVTRPLIRHYFRNLDELLRTSTQYIRLLFQRLAIDALVSGTSADEMLGLYIDACFRWIERHKTHAQVWFAFLLDSSRSNKARALNSAAVQRGEERIQALLERGRADGIFRFEDGAAASKMIQTQITGALITYISEDLPDREAYVASVRNACFKLLGVL